MNSICSYEDFVNLINDRTVKVTNLVDTNIHMENWTPGRFVEYLGGLEQHKQETGVKIDYVSSTDYKGRIGTINILICFQSTNVSEESNYYMQWSVKYKDN